MIYLSFIEEEKEKLEAKIRELETVSERVDSIVSDISYDLRQEIEQRATEAAAELIDDLELSDDDPFGERIQEVVDYVVEEFNL